MRRQLTAMLCLGLFAISTAAEAGDPDVVPIGIVDSLIQSLSPAKRKLLDAEFPGMVKDFTGMTSEIIQGGDPKSAVEKLEKGTWRLGVFQGVEFAWAQSRDTKLKPLVLAINREKAIHALLVAKKDSEAAKFADLKGKTIHLLTGREHCRLFAENGAGGDAKAFFGKVLPVKNVEDALDDVLRGKVDAAIIDGASMETYKELKPGAFNRLKEIAKSEPFPPTVIAYREGGLSEKALDNFRAGMIKANDTEKGRIAMANVNITSFEPVPADFDKSLKEILKAYPAPK